MIGAGAYRDLGGGICEMKRLYVGEKFHGHGTGRALCEALIATARDDGFKLMRLDTGNLLKEAIAASNTYRPACGEWHVLKVGDTDFSVRHLETALG